MTRFIPGIGVAVRGIGGAEPYPSFAGYASSGLGSTGVNLGSMGARGYMDGVGAAVGNAFMRPHPYDNLTPMGPLKDYKEGGSSVKFESFNGESDKKKALSYVQQFDNAFSGGNSEGTSQKHQRLEKLPLS